VGDRVRERLRVSQGLEVIYLCYWASLLWVAGPNCISKRGCGESGTGGCIPSPSPPYPTGTTLAPIRSLWGSILYHPRPLIKEFPTGNRGSGPRCHPYCHPWPIRAEIGDPLLPAHRHPELVRCRVGLPPASALRRRSLLSCCCWVCFAPTPRPFAPTASCR
jgi:hypothetical protein